MWHESLPLSLLFLTSASALLFFHLMLCLVFPLLLLFREERYAGFGPRTRPRTFEREKNPCLCFLELNLIFLGRYARRQMKMILIVISYMSLNFLEEVTHLKSALTRARLTLKFLNEISKNYIKRCLDAKKKEKNKSFTLFKEFRFIPPLLFPPCKRSGACVPFFLLIRFLSPSRQLSAILHPHPKSFITTPHSDRRE
ncbi:hypothetical protein IEQ34_012619 [Dendrobium chrysotoxum]|uniref:Secreted protein n=1 Tax=Dendrobium chrysotoxum TaxID=161865 RepID=A0AAV7G614_DENCH|nr:hypothetical protein IEQ34_012619 [Dendrobium chrysotoxum]